MAELKPECYELLGKLLQGSDCYKGELKDTQYFPMR